MIGFDQMNSWGVKQLREFRNQLRDTLAEEIHKRDALKAEIVWLQKEIDKYRGEDTHE